MSQLRIRDHQWITQETIHEAAKIGIAKISVEHSKRVGKTYNTKIAEKLAEHASKIAEDKDFQETAKLLDSTDVTEESLSDICKELMGKATNVLTGLVSCIALTIALIARRGLTFVCQILKCFAAIVYSIYTWFRSALSKVLSVAKTVDDQVQVARSNLQDAVIEDWKCFLS
ncbi:uncharacterized protein LOC131957422 [Physella acuta]|uniref:uncharacterized protein LOC131957422 n=1 Tax=Physella acuta TaxID=109671 RepID=UPI0027DC63E6|nr:uncharacterized protein LOC131957422 [Physella acuta]